MEKENYYIAILIVAYLAQRIEVYGWLINLKATINYAVLFFQCQLRWSEFLEFSQKISL